jgi:hypothetical protein
MVTAVSQLYLMVMVITTIPRKLKLNLLEMFAITSQLKTLLFVAIDAHG